MTGTEYQKLAMRTNDRKNVDRLTDKILQVYLDNGFKKGRIRWKNE